MSNTSGVPIIGLFDDGRRLAVILDNAGSSDIPNIIRTLRRGELLQ